MSGILAFLRGAGGQAETVVPVGQKLVDQIAETGANAVANLRVVEAGGGRAVTALDEQSARVFFRQGAPDIVAMSRDAEHMAPYEIGRTQSSLELLDAMAGGDPNVARAIRSVRDLTPSAADDFRLPGADGYEKAIGGITDLRPSLAGELTPGTPMQPLKW